MCEEHAEETRSGADEMEWPPYIQKKGALEKVGCGCKKGTANLNVTAKDAVNWFYEILSVLDTKASALMRLNGILIAAAAFLLGTLARPNAPFLSVTALDSILAIFSALLSAISIGLCLFVVNVSWDFLGKVTINGGDFDFHEEIKSLENVVNNRQSLYRYAWRISLIASTCFLIEFLCQAIYVIYYFFMHVACGV